MTTVEQAAPGTVEHWAKARPDGIAIVDGRTELSWSAWNAQADRLADSLEALGLRAGDIVATRLQVRHEWAVAAQALAKLGCRVLLMNWRLTPNEVRRIMESSKAAAIICDDAAPALLAPALQGLGLKAAVSVDVPAEGFADYAALIDGKGSARFSTRPPPLIVYTSGTTGLPKGIIAGQHTGQPDEADLKRLAEYQASVADARPQYPGDVILLTMPLNHGAGPAIIWGAARFGNLLVMQRRFDPEGALQLIARHRVTMWNAVPTLFKRLASLPPETFKAYDIGSLRALSVSAAPISIGLKTWVLDNLGDCLSESYGTSETGVLTTLVKERQRSKIGSSGMPHAQVELSIRAPDGTERRAGEVGEIWARTPTVIRSYLGGEPIGEDTLDKDGFFRTGDAGYLDADGFLFITDRTKDMIVSGGVNIYPAEIEAVIAGHPAVQDVAVIGIPDEEFGERVKAVCELRPGKSADEAAILAHCREHLASYKQPKSVTFAAELPRNTMGKILKRELRDPYWEGRARTV